jgi:hypothetical protein
MNNTLRIIPVAQQALSMALAAMVTSVLLVSISAQADEQHHDAVNMAQAPAVVHSIGA